MNGEQTAQPDYRRKVAEEPCRCVRCDFCGGTGDRPFPLSIDDVVRAFQLSELEPCDQCSGGIVEVCDRCQLLEDLDHEDD